LASGIVSVRKSCRLAIAFVPALVARRLRMRGGRRLRSLGLGPLLWLRRGWLGLRALLRLRELRLGLRALLRLRELRLGLRALLRLRELRLGLRALLRLRELRLRLRPLLRGIRRCPRSQGRRARFTITRTRVERGMVALLCRA